MWALRGGGGNFGVATALTYRLHPLAMITGGLIAHPIDAAPELLRFYRDAVADVSDDLTVFAGLVPAPDGSGNKLSALVVCHAGEPEAAERELAPFKAFGSPLVTEVGPMPYPVINTMLDAGFPKGSLNYWLSSFTKGLSDALIDTAVERYASIPSPMTPMLFEHFHGAVTRIEPTATAVPHREPGLEPADPVGVDRPGRHRRPTSRGRRRRTRRSSRSCRSGAGSTTSATTRPRTPSAPPTARTTTGYARSSAGTTRTTSSTSTTTSRPSPLGSKLPGLASSARASLRCRPRSPRPRSGCGRPARPSPRAPRPSRRRCPWCRRRSRRRGPSSCRAGR